MSSTRRLSTGCMGMDDRLVAVATAGGTELPCDAVFVFAAFRASPDLAASLCEGDEAGFAVTDADGRTSHPGVWAIGNAADPLAYLVYEKYDNACFINWIVKYLLESSLAPRTR